MTPPRTSPPQHDNPSLLRRIPLAFSAFFRLLADADLARRFEALAAGPAPEPAAQPRTEPTALRQASPDSALQLLALLQRDARLIDFAREDLAGYTDEQIGAAARLVHEGCGKVLHEYFDLAPIRPEAEGSRVTLAPGFDASAVRVTGNVVGAPPFTGSLTHRGWRVNEVRLPQLAGQHDTRVIVPAEVEL